MKILLILLIGCLPFGVWGQHTFSIVAVDPLTGEVGSAGASCVSGFSVSIISYVLPNVGAMNTQAWWQSANKNRGAQLMLSGHSPQQIIDSLSTDDRGTDGRDERWRQYGVVTLNGGTPLSAGWTGDSADDWKGHIPGPNYSIQGNILLGPQILDSMESRFLNTPGDLATKLMAALQGANVVGADTRCMAAGTSSTGAYIQVARPNDVAGAFYLNLNVPPLSSGREPIDSLQTLFDAWQMATGVMTAEEAGTMHIWPVPGDGRYQISFPNAGNQHGLLTVWDVAGRQLKSFDCSGKAMELDLRDQVAGVYFVRMEWESGEVSTAKIVQR